MTTINIRGIPVSFPFKPYDIQKDYMEKVIECLQDQTNGVLESPTGTGKTLSLLCSSLAWLSIQKAKFQAEARLGGNFFAKSETDPQTNVAKLMWDIPTIIYASRTHSQLTQAMQELKRTSYAHVRATIVGSRDQLCIHPDVAQQSSNANKISMCQAMVKTKSCYLQNRVERMTADRAIQELNITDIEDLVKLGKKHKFCPYYMTKELKQHADIVFLPYNYLLDPKARRANQLDLKNSVVILDEAHNVEKVCEDSASFQIKTTDIALCIDEITHVMKYLEMSGDLSSGDTEKDFSAEDLALLKTMLLNLEKVIDDIPLQNNDEGSTFEGKYIFEILKNAGITDESQPHILSLLSRLIQFLNTSKENPFQRTGTGLQILEDLLLIVFQKISEEFKEMINKCYKVHLIVEVDKKRTQDDWLSKATTKKKSACRVLSYWCFSPNFGMQMLLEQGVRCVILTSGTLAPLKPLISELGIKVDVRLENPHVVTNEQICVKILGSGPDGVPLNASYQNRDSQKYITSLGMAIINISRQVPNGLLVFFPSYAVLTKCQNNWQQSGIWNSMNELKPVHVEPKNKDEFNLIMSTFYDRIRDPLYKGATFMAVCRGKVSEGLDFADINGRAVIVTGLPYPPFKDPRVVLKRKYLDLCRLKNSEYLSGQEWYGLEATRAVNQAIGRVIRHKNDYGAILLLDNRFNSSAIRNQLSLWVRGHVTTAQNFGQVIRDVRAFFKNAEKFDTLRDQQLQLINPVTPSSSDDGSLKIYNLNKTKASTNNANIIDLTADGDDNDDDADSAKENVNKRSQNTKNQPKPKKMKLLTVDYTNAEVPATVSSSDTIALIETIKKNLGKEQYEQFIQNLGTYKKTADIQVFIQYLNEVFRPRPHLRFLIRGMLPYIKDLHKIQFLKYLDDM